MLQVLASVPFSSTRPFLSVPSGNPENYETGLKPGCL
jgi:hypothetical protein